MTCQKILHSEKDKYDDLTPNYEDNPSHNKIFWIYVVITSRLLIISSYSEKSFVKAGAKSLVIPGVNLQQY